MFHTAVQTVFLTTIGIMVLGLIAPIFYTTEKARNKHNPLLERLVVTIGDGKSTTQSTVIGHLESLINRQHLEPQNICLVAYDKGVYILEKGHRYQQRLQALSNKGMPIYACDNGLTTIRSKHGGQFTLMEGVTIVPNGKQQIEALMDMGYTDSLG